MTRRKAEAETNPENMERPEEWPQAPEDQVETQEQDLSDDPLLPRKSLFRIDEVADYLGYSKQTIRLWIDHGILRAEKHNREFRISRMAILELRSKSKFRPLEDGFGP